MIGVFDSGVGGLSVFREIRKVLPEQSYIYYSDNAHCPYGEKSTDYIIERAREITSFLLSKGAEIIVVACNTATAAAISVLREEFHVKFIGMEPAIKQAALSTRSGVVGVLATAGTLRADKYLDTREKYSDGIKVVENVGKGFVELVESGNTTGPQAEKVIAESLLPLLEEGVDTIVLGCTHYPFLKDSILRVASSAAAPHSISLIDPAPAVARQLVKVMDQQGISMKSPGGFSIELHSSGDPSCLKSTYNELL